MLSQDRPLELFVDIMGTIDLSLFLDVEIRSEIRESHSWHELTNGLHEFAYLDT